ncbi:MAG: glycosyltransferase family 39 protein [Candidatus Aureabacteria bacterium]|nr:glycosyltransferase family 39 protein [Candidatus Auribacterota bacterium]
MSNAIWIRYGASLYGRDVVGHLQLVVKFYYAISDILRSAVSPLAKIDKILSLLHEDSLPFHCTYMWPKLVHLVATIPCFLFGLRLTTIIQCNILFFGILIISTYFIGKRCYSSAAGLFAAALVSLYPAIWGQSRKFGLDFPVTAMTSLAVSVLICTDSFRNRKYSLLFGVVTGLGILTKGQIILYIGGPMLVDFFMGVVERRPQRRGCLINFIIAILASMIVSSPWWWGIAGALWRAYFVTVTDYPFSWAYAYQRQIPLTFKWFLFHPVHGIISVSLLYAFIFALSLPGYLRSRSMHKRIISSWVIVTYALWTISNIKRDTDFYPCLPAIALISAIGIMSWKRLFLKRAVIAGAILLGLVQYFSASFSREGYLLWTPNNPYGKPSEPDGYNTPYRPPYPNNYQEVMQKIAQGVRSRDTDAKYARIGVIETTGSDRWQEYNTAILDYYFRCDSPDKFIYRSRHTPEAFLEHAMSFEYLIVMDRRNGENPDWSEMANFFSAREWEGTLRRNFGSVDLFYKVLKSYEGYTIIERATLLPDNCGVFLCRRNPLRVSMGETIYASAYTYSDLITAPLAIGARGVPRHGFYEADYDLFFPYWLHFPLVGSDLRYPGDAYFCDYDLEFVQEGSFHLYGEFAVARACPISVYCDGDMRVQNLNLYTENEGAHPGYAWRSLGTVTLAPGIHRIRIEGRDDFPLFRALKFSSL